MCGVCFYTGYELIGWV